MFLQPQLFALKDIPHVKYEKKLNDNACFFTIFTTLGIILPRFYPKTTSTLIFFLAGFQWNILRDSIGINNFNWNPVVLKIFC